MWEQMVQLGRVSERRGVTTQGLSSVGGGGEPFQIRVKGKGSQEVRGGRCTGWSSEGDGRGRLGRWRCQREGQVENKAGGVESEPTLFVSPHDGHALGRGSLRSCDYCITVRRGAVPFAEEEAGSSPAPGMGGLFSFP